MTGPTRCTPNPKVAATQPELVDVKSKAINLMNGATGSLEGLLLQVEGGSIDKRDHAADGAVRSVRRRS